MSFGARARISRGAIQHNLQIIAGQSPGVRVIAVIKANAYGHGLVDVARILAEADCLAVARLSEAQEIRGAGIDTPILLLSGVTSSTELAAAVDKKLQICVHNEPQLAMLEQFGAADLFAWLEIDTGMNRLGFPPAAAQAAIRRLENCAAVGKLGLMTHFANADNIEDPMTRVQIAAFSALCGKFDGPISLANSAGHLGWSQELKVFDAFRHSGRLFIRPGISLFGVSPFPGKLGAELGLRPAMQFEAHLVALRSIAAGARVGYGGTWQAEQGTTIGVISAGYGDGYSYFMPEGTPILLNGRRVPLVGRVSMDLCTVDLGSDAREKIGDPAILWGAGLPVEEIAQYARTIAYQLVCGVTKREKRKFED